MIRPKGLPDCDCGPWAKIKMELAALRARLDRKVDKDWPTEEGKFLKIVNGEVSAAEVDIPDIEVDDSLSIDSENPVQNKVVTQAITGHTRAIGNLAEAFSALDTEVDLKASTEYVDAQVAAVEDALEEMPTLIGGDMGTPVTIYSQSDRILYGYIFLTDEIPSTGNIIQSVIGKATITATVFGQSYTISDFSLQYLAAGDYGDAGWYMVGQVEIRQYNEQWATIDYDISEWCMLYAIGDDAVFKIVDEDRLGVSLFDMGAKMLSGLRAQVYFRNNITVTANTFTLMTSSYYVNSAIRTMSYQNGVLYFNDPGITTAYNVEAQATDAAVTFPAENYLAFRFPTGVNAVKPITSNTQISGTIYGNGAVIILTFTISGDAFTGEVDADGGRGVKWMLTDTMANLYTAGKITVDSLYVFATYPYTTWSYSYGLSNSELYPRSTDVIGVTDMPFPAGPVSDIASLVYSHDTVLTGVSRITVYGSPVPYLTMNSGSMPQMFIYAAAPNTTNNYMPGALWLDTSAKKLYINVATTGLTPTWYEIALTAYSP